MNKNKRSDVKIRIDTSELMEATKIVQDDDLAGYIQKLKLVKYMYYLPDWMLSYPVPVDYPPSALPAAKCWLKAHALQKTLRIGVHPAHTIETLLVNSSVTVVGESLTYHNEKKEAVVLENVRGYHVVNKENTSTIIASAMVADILAYYTRVDATGSATPTITPVNEKKMVMFNIDCVNLRLKIAGDITSESVARDAVYSYCERNPDQAFALCNNFLKNFPQYATLSTVALNAYTDMRAKDKNLPPLSGVLMPLPGKANLITISDMKTFYEYLNDCHKVRGSDNGIGTITNGYVFGCCTRAMVKCMTMFLDLRQLMCLYQVQVLLIHGKMSEFIKRILIANGFYLVDPTNVNTKTLTPLDIKNNSFNVYNSVDPEIRYGIFYVASSEGPTIRGKAVEFKPLNVEGIFRMDVGSPDNIAFRALRAHMNPSMERQDFQYGILPSSLPHNGQVLVTHPAKRSVEVSSMIKRACRANSMRNNVIITKRSWLKIDPYQDMCGYLVPYILPKMITKLTKEAVDFSVFTEETKEEAEDLMAAVKDLKFDPKMIRPPVKGDNSKLFSEVLNLVLASGDAEAGFISIFRTWKHPKSYASLSALSTEYNEAQVLEELIRMAPAHDVKFRNGYKKLLAFREEDKVKKMVQNKESKKDDSDDDKDEDEYGDPAGEDDGDLFIKDETDYSGFTRDQDDDNED